MTKKRRTTVQLPHVTPYVELPDHLAKPLQLIVDAGDKGISTLELQAAGITGCASLISRLIKAGARIETELRNAVDCHGNVRKNIGYYIYRNWQ